MFVYILIIPHHIEFCSKLMDIIDAVNTLWVDGIACFNKIEDILFRVAERKKQDFAKTLDSFSPDTKLRM
jgi:hypothetical protein